MNDFEVIKDIDGKTYLSFEKKKEEEKNQIGNKFDDFEILKLMGEGQFGKVFKVASKLNNKVYAMKMVNLGELKDPDDDKAYKLALNESKFLTVLSHPHIIKYYKNFTEGDFLYIIVENAENGDLDDFIDAHKKSGRHIPEEELWSIFLQCMKGLAYVHDLGVIHRDIKPGNILMDNNMTIKIGDFGVSTVKKNENEKNTNIKYLNASYKQILSDEDMQYGQTLVFTDGYGAKEMLEENEYDQKIDVYSMGVTFYEMCFFHKPDNLGDDDNNVNYSKEMLDIINEMLEEDKDKRKPSKYFLEKIREQFSNKYSRNTSIDGIVRCLYTFEDITKFYKKLDESQYKNKTITEAFIKCLKNFTGQDMIYYINSIKYFREILCTENSTFNKTKEINPKLVLTFLIRKLHDEMNINISTDNKVNNYYITSGEERAITSKIEMMIIFQNKFFSQLNSYISQKMMGLIKSVYVCNICKTKTYSFLGYFFVNIDLENILKFMSPDIEKYFEYENRHYILNNKYCIKCIDQTNHQEYKQYFTVPDYLIININRGKNNSCRVPIKLKKFIDLTNLVESQGKKYKLVSFINRNYENERYISFIEFKIFNKWYRCENDNVIEYNPEEHQDMFNDLKGELMMAFYEAL